MKSWTEIGQIIEKGAFGLLSWFPDTQNRSKLFYIGGLDPSYNARTSVELYDEDTLIHFWRACRRRPNLTVGHAACD